MGGNIALELADWYPDRFRALIGLECGAHSPGFYIDWLDHPQVNTTEVNAYSCWGLMAPAEPGADSSRDDVSVRTGGKRRVQRRPVLLLDRPRLPG